MNTEASIPNRSRIDRVFDTLDNFPIIDRATILFAKTSFTVFAVWYVNLLTRDALLNRAVNSTTTERVVTAGFLLGAGIWFRLGRLINATYDVESSVVNAGDMPTVVLSDPEYLADLIAAAVAEAITEGKN